MFPNSYPDRYRQIQSTSDSSQAPQIERKQIQVKCSWSKQLFETLLIRGAGKHKRFRVVGFELVPAKAIVPHSGSQHLSTLIVEFLGKILNRGSRRESAESIEPLDESGEVIHLGIAASA